MQVGDGNFFAFTGLSLRYVVLIVLPS
jgi:hypothetical protein